MSRQVQTCKEIKKSPLNKKETKLKKLPTKEQEVLDQNIQMTYFWFSCKCQTKNNLILKNKKKSKNLQKIICIKKNYFFLAALPLLSKIHIKPEDRHTKNYETFVEFNQQLASQCRQKLLRFFFFLSYSTQYKREEI